MAALIAGTPASSAPFKGRVLRFTIPAPSLHESSRAVRVYLPPAYDAPGATSRRFPVVFLLHGFPGTSGDWLGRGHAAETADALIASGTIPDLILVCPDGSRGLLGRTLYANSYDGSFCMEDFLTRDLVAWVDSTLRTRPGPRTRGVIGLSDGGTGAVNLLLRHGDVFGAAGAHSANFRLRRGFGMGSVVGTGEPAESRLATLSPLEYLRHGLPPPGDRVLYLDCGTSDESIGQNRELDALLDSLGVRHTYREFPGSHTWSYWREHLRQSLTAVSAGMR